MARSPRSGTVTTTTGTSVDHAHPSSSKSSSVIKVFQVANDGTSTPGASSSKHELSAAAETALPPKRKSSRVRRPSTTANSPTTLTSSTPSTPLPLIVADTSHSTPTASTSKLPPPSRQPVEFKAHALRSVIGGNERVACPFPGQYGGRDKCGVMEDEEGDEVLMGICAACAAMDNRALSPDEIAGICFNQGWLRPPSAAVEPSTLINNAIRSHQRRCQNTNPPRQPLLSKHHLSGSTVEAALESALHPNAFDGQIRPKGAVWYLSNAEGRAGWKDPFQGLELPKVPIRKPLPSKPKSISGSSVDKKKPTSKGKTKAMTPTTQSAPVKRIRLVLTGGTLADDDETVVVSDRSSRSDKSRSVSRSQSRSSTPMLVQPVPMVVNPIKRHGSRRIRNILDSSSESSSDSDEDMAEIQPRLRVRTDRKPPPPPIAINSSPRVAHPRQQAHSPFLDLFYPSPTHHAFSPFPPPVHSPFPSHSLDNTTWAVRHENDGLANFETSSSSSDEELREQDWGTMSGILVRGVADDESNLPWTAEDEEEKMIEATDAMKFLFPTATTLSASTASSDDGDTEPKIELNRLDNRPATSDTSSLAESTSTATAHAISKGQLKAGNITEPIALPAWTNLSSPVSSPNLRVFANLAPVNMSPLQDVSKVRSSFDPDDIMDLDVDQHDSRWLDDSGELPVKAEDTFSDAELGSTLGEASTPEHDRQLHTAAWAREAAEAVAVTSDVIGLLIKEEPQDFSSPATTTDLESTVYDGRHGSRESSTSSHTPSSRSSELPPFEIDEGMSGSLLDTSDEVLLGPESVSLEELDDWMISRGSGEIKEKSTPHRGRSARNRYEPLRCSGSWGGIGVGNAFVPIPFSLLSNKSTQPRSKSLRSRRTRSTARSNVHRGSSPKTEESMDMDVEVDGMEVDAIGTEDLEKAKAEAEEREAQYRKDHQEKAEKQRLAFQACRQALRDADGVCSPMDGPVTASTPHELWSGNDGGSGWGSVDSLILGSGALSPLALQSMSTLSLGPLSATSVDPKALTSPPLSQTGFGAHMATLDEVLSQAEVDAVMSSFGGPGIGQNSATTTVLPVSAAAANTIVVAPPKSSTKQKPKLAPAPAPALPIPIVKQANTDSSTIVELPSTLAVGVAGAPDHSGVAVKTKAKSTSPPMPTTTASPATTNSVSPPPSASSASTPNSVPPSTASSVSSHSMPPPTNAPRTVTKRLCAGVEASVVDHIPVYIHHHHSKDGQLVVLRRLDTDFVNGTSLLCAIGVPLIRAHSEYLNAPSPWLASHFTVPTISSVGIAYSPGVAGVWVPLVEARDYARRLGVNDGIQLTSLLRGDLFHLFATLAGINPEHAAGESFGSDFVAGSIPSVPSSTSSSSLSSSSNNSKSTPNLVALGTSLPNHLRIGSNQITKGPLVRSALSTPEGCPLPKRRRATIVGGQSPFGSPTPTPGAAGVNGKGMVKTTTASNQSSNTSQTIRKPVVHGNLGIQIKSGIPANTLINVNGNNGVRRPTRASIGNIQVQSTAVKSKMTVSR